MFKVGEIRKHLKGCRGQIRIHRGNHGIYSARLLVCNPGGGFDPYFLAIDCQANDLTFPGNEKSPRGDAKHFRSFPKLSGFYAVTVKTEESFDYPVDKSEHSDRARAFFTLIRKIVEEKNLAYVYPDCSLSQVVAALEVLGCPIELVEVEKMELRDWLRARRRDIGEEVNA